MRSYRHIDARILLVAGILRHAAEVPVPLSVERSAKESKNRRSHSHHARLQQPLWVDIWFIYAGFFHLEGDGELLKNGLGINVLSSQRRRGSEVEENEEYPLHLAFSAMLRL